MQALVLFFLPTLLSLAAFVYVLVLATRLVRATERIVDAVERSAASAR